MIVYKSSVGLPGQGQTEDAVWVEFIADGTTVDCASFPQLAEAVWEM